jgi:hypothetical protein
MAPREVMIAALDTWLASVGLRVTPIKERSPAERLADLQERVLAELGPVGARIVEDERSRP